MKKILITGISGFVGQYLAEYLLSTNNYEIIGTYHSDGGAQKLDQLKDKIKLEQLDVNNPDQVTNSITSNKPDAIIHLAALTFVPESFQKPFEYISTNIHSELNLLETLRQNNLTQTRLMTISTSETYGLVKPTDLPIKETNSLNPTSPYAVSKIAQDYLSLQYHLSYKLDIIRVRPFNHIGPRQSERFVVSDLAKQIAQIEKQQKDPIIKVGNLEAKRDFTDVRDIVKGYEQLLEKGISGEIYNIGSGKSQKIQEILDLLISFSTAKITVEVDQNKLRPSDNPDITCDYTKLNSLTGWKPEIPLEKTLKEILDYWRNIV